MKKILILLTIILFLSSCSYHNSEDTKKIANLEKQIENNKNEIIYEIEESGLKGNEKIINCKLNLFTTIVSEKGQNIAKGNIGIQKKPLNLIFSGIFGNKVYLKSNAGETELTKIDNGDIIYLLEKTGGGYINIFTIFPKSGKIIFSKQYNLLGNAFGTQLIGTCN